MRAKYRVKVRALDYPSWSADRWKWYCCACARGSAFIGPAAEAYAQATQHAATCAALNWANWEAACPSCRLYGRVAKACLICLGYGYERGREGLA